MGWWDSVMGRTTPKQPNLDSLFLIPGAAITLQTAAGFLPTGTGAVCYRAATGAAFAQTQRDMVSLLQGDPDSPQVTTSQDQYGFTWLVVEGDRSDVSGLCTDLHAVNTSLEAQGFGHGLLCTLVPFRDTADRTFGLVYLYKQGTFYPFAQVPGQQRRDNLLEIQMRDALAGELPVEKDLQRWLAVWNAPGL